jgi:DNA-binding NarL/FixJ family response regulator
VAKPPAKVRSRDLTKIPELSNVLDALMNDDKITRISLDVDKIAGVLRYNAISSDGRVATKSILGPGLEEVVRYDPSMNTRRQRDINIIKLLNKGLTQTEISTRLGISQALVSKVKRDHE